LIELVVVLAILGIMAVLAAPNLRTVVGSAEPATPAEELAGVLRTARDEAVRRAVTTCAEWSPSSGEFRVWVRAAGRDSALAEGRLQGLAGVASPAPTALARHVCFQPWGTAEPGIRWTLPDAGAVVDVDAWDGRLAVSDSR
jgi:Tfp pilus assembly protein FimT